MAYTKVFAIRARLDDRVKYAINGDKTELGEKINYAADLQKTNLRIVKSSATKSQRRFQRESASQGICGV